MFANSLPVSIAATRLRRVILVSVGVLVFQAFGSIAGAQSAAYVGVQPTLLASGSFEPNVVAVDASGDLFVGNEFADSQGGVLEVPVTGSGYGTPVPVPLTEPSYPRVLSFDAAGDLFVLDEEGGVFKLPWTGSGWGAQVTVPVSGLSVEDGMAVDANGDVFVSDPNGDGGVVEVPWTGTGWGTQATLATGMYFGASLLAVDGSQNLYVACVYRSSGGQTISVVIELPWTGSGYDAPLLASTGVTTNSIAADPAGNLFIADAANDVLVEVPAGQGPATQFTIATGTHNYTGIAVDTHGHILFSDIGTVYETETGNAVRFGNVNLCPAGQNAPAPCSEVLTLNYSVTASGTLGTPKVLTGGQPNLDFTLATGGTCAGSVTAGSICTVNVAFTPVTAGLRSGALQLVDSGGNVLATTFLQGTGMGPQIGFGSSGGMTFGNGLYDASSIAADAAGNIFVADSNNGRVVEVPANGGPQTTVAGFSFPLRVAVDGAGDLFVVNESGGGPIQIIEVPAGGGPQFAVASNLTGAGWVGTDWSGDLFVSVSNGQGGTELIEIPSTGGPQMRLAPNLTEPAEVVVDAVGNMFVADFGNNGQLIEIPANGGPQITVESGAYPGQLSMDGVGNLYYLSGGKVVEIPAGGGPQLTIPLPFGYWQALTVDPLGNLFLVQQADSTGLEIQRGGPPPAFNFANTNVGSVSSDSPQSVQVLNIGNQPLAVSGPVLSANFSQVFGSSSLADCTGSFSLAPAASCNLSLSFDPEIGGYLTGAATLTDNSMNASSANGGLAAQSVVLSGTGLALQQTTTTLTANPVSITYTGQVTLTANVTAPQGTPVGTVTFLTGATVLGTATLNANGTATLTTNALPAGSDSLTASYAADINYLASVSSPFIETVARNTASAGNANVCAAGLTSPAPCSQTLTVTYTLGASAVLGTPIVSTQGAPNLDFTLAGTTCTGASSAGATCTVTVKFTPRYAGVRAGGVQIVDTSGNALTTFLIQGMGVAPQVAFNSSSQTTLPGSFEGPFSVAVDAGENLYVADLYAGVWKVAPGVGQIPIDPTNVTGASAVAVDGAGDVFIADSSGQDATFNDVVEVPAGGGTPFVVATNLIQPGGLAIDGAGDLFIADTYNGQIVEVAADTGLQTSVVTGLNYPYGVAVDGAGNLFIADSNNLRVVEVPAGCTAVGCQSLVGTGWGYPTGVAVDAAGDVFVVDDGYGTLVEVPAGGGSQVILASSASAGLIGEAVDAAGNIFVADFSDGLVDELPRSQPPAFNFAATNIGATSSDSPQSVAVQNIGNAALTVSGLSIGANFAKVAGPGTPADCAGNSSLAAGAECNLSLSFVPVSPGALAASATLTDNALNVNASTQAIALSGIGLATTPIAQLSASSLNFNPLSYGGTKTLPLTITNVGAGTLTLAPSINGPSYRVTSNNCGAGVSAGNSCTLQIEFAPVAVGTHNDVLTLTTNGPSNPAVSLIGAATGVGASSDTLNFGSIAFPGSLTLTLTVRDVGVAGTVTLTGMSINGPSYSILTTANTCAAGLKSGGACSLQVLFNPVAVGTHDDVLTVTVSSGEVFTVSLLGTATGVGPTAPLLAFGTVTERTTATLPLTIENKGTAGAPTVGLAFSNPDYSVFASTCAAGVAPNQTCALQVQFSPSKSGTDNGTLTITSTSGTVSIVQLHGKGANP